jgi:hypothetical protein
LLDNCPRSKDETKYDHPFTGNNLMVMSNGACGSSCAIVCAFLQEQAKVPSVFMTSEHTHSNNNATLYSYAGGQVLQSDLIFELLKSSKMPDRPKPFPVNARLSLTFRSIYSKSKSAYPLEFVALRPTRIVPIGVLNALQPDRQWEAAVTALGWISPRQEYAVCTELMNFVLQQKNATSNAQNMTESDQAAKETEEENTANLKQNTLGGRSVTEARQLCENHGVLKLGKCLAKNEVQARMDAVDDFVRR